MLAIFVIYLTGYRVKARSDLIPKACILAFTRALVLYVAPNLGVLVMSDYVKVSILFTSINLVGRRARFI